MPLVRFLSAVLVVVALVGASLSAQATSSEWVHNDHSSVRLVSGVASVGSTETLPFGLHFDLPEGWKVYWRSPGDAGYPPELDWSNADNVAGSEIKWPTPFRFEVLGLSTLGYKEEVVYPIELAVENPGEPLKASADVRYLVCSEICVPVQTTLTIDLPAGTGEPSEHAHLIGRFDAQVPQPGPAQGLRLIESQVFNTAQDDVAMLRLTVDSDAPIENPNAFTDGPIELLYGTAQASVEAGSMRAVLDIPLDGLSYVEGGIAGREMRAVVTDGPRAVEFAFVPEITGMMVPTVGGEGASGSEAQSYGLFVILGFALLGGLILNLMPCVLPVLSIKVMGLVGHGGGEKSHVRLSFLASSAGIVFSFLVLAGGLIALKAGGMAIGWGIQFQYPWFLAALALIVVLFACNLWGLFDINLPSWMASAGEKGSRGSGLGGHFLQGAFATILATPCSAPFLGTAVGFALARSPLEILAVFSALGVGMALPYLLVAALPGLATRLPKPGPWMGVLQKVLALALVATAVWLLSVIMAQSGAVVTAVLAALFMLMAAVLWAKGASKAAWAGVVVLAFASVTTPGLLGEKPVQAASDYDWAVFDETEITQRVADGQVVFVDVTADWCITCQVNKKLVMDQGDVAALLGGDSVTPMRADWTNPDDTIANYLARHGRYGIPFNVVYGPGAPEGIALPELLTEEIVLKALREAG